MTVKALFVLDQVNRGGIEIQALDIVRLAHLHDIEVTVVTGGGQLLDDFERSGCEVIVLKRRFLLDLFYSARLRRIIDEGKIQIVQGHQAVDSLHLWIATRGRSHIKSIVTVDVIGDAKNRRALKFIIPRVDAVVFPSSAFRDQARERYGVDASGNGSVIPNAADPERMLKVASTVRDELGVDESATIIGMIGNFYRDPRKDQLTLVKALPKVFAEFPNAHCLFIGKTEPGAEHKLNACRQFCIENGIDQRVHFLGSRGDVPNILATLDVFVLSSLQEGAPVAILEAIFAHVPVVASDIPPHVEYTCDKPILKLFRTSNDVDLSSKIIDLLEDQTAARKMANCAYDHALKNFSTSVRLERLKNLYERLLSE